jgi:hypothetical protein
MPGLSFRGNVAGWGPGGLRGFSKSEQYAESSPREGGVFNEYSRSRGLGTAIEVRSSAELKRRFWVSLTEYTLCCGPQ